MARLQDLKQKEVINIKDGARLGYVADVNVDDDDGSVTHIVVPVTEKILGLFGVAQEYVIAWEDVTQIGDDIILVKVDTNKALKNN